MATYDNLRESLQFENVLLESKILISLDIFAYTYIFEQYTVNISFTIR